ncbi:hypothetical protein [Klebsiella michiganensis]|uniref:hypothetical protein n=1 Tax=Klebsiella michiganensis TaxID=1134687 RepID=UPI0007CBCB7C|nr:hypothetical protein [Klebsiella michiganensis]DAM04385.1 MAG TPA: hypothetical protein [Caudoviricetes sp.]HCI5143937.1 hypothetical protein [Klebsiella pneumoniae]MBA4428826.1 hypothetical protein [Klebsiella michiganensis]MEB6472199.1 hypothetical protein [Klebsiella michiganensis]SAP97292.1 Uncharacterised protein [Klebsiella michiganensis]
MDKFDRNLQREILKCCIDAYPNAIRDLGDDYRCDAISSSPKDKLLANLFYLSGHNLITISPGKSVIDEDSAYSILDSAEITCRGIDFMQNDGGLGAILSVQTIKFHRDAVVVLEDLIAISSMSEEQKEIAKSTLSGLSAEALKTIVQTLTSVGLSILIGK